MNMKAEMKRSRDLKQLNNEIPFPIHFGRWTVEEPDSNKHLKRFLLTF